MPAVSIVIPLLNEEENLPVLYEALQAALQDMLPPREVEFIFVDDGSTDHTFGLIRSLSETDRRVRGISLSRNFGHQIALYAGMEYARGQVVITMDGDLQHPPELIPAMWRKHQEGYDVVNTVRTASVGSGYFKKTTSRWFYRLINSLSEVPIEPASSDFRLMSRKATDAFLRMPEPDRFTRGLVRWMGFPQASIPYEAPARHKGRSKYSPARMVRLGLDGLTAFSGKPLRLVFFLGLLIFLLGLAYALYAIIQHVGGQTVPGWTSILVSVLILGGVQLLSIGLLSEYVLRVFNASKNRPKYFVRELAGH